MKKLVPLVVVAVLLIGCNSKSNVEVVKEKTVCNPMNLSYRFCLDEPSRREAADPTIVLFKDTYYLFASKSGGYWHSQDLVDWKFIATNKIPVEDYAPTAVGIGDTLYFLASSHERNTIFKSADPINNEWKIAKEKIDIPAWDPAFYLDDDGKLYLYWGCSDVNPLYGIEIDYKNNFEYLGKPVELKHHNPDEFGWEVPGDYNTRVGNSPWIEGAWVNKYKGKYYLQYAGPGTEYKSYSDAVYVSDNPLGPYKAQSHNPFAYKPEGFAAGAGHGSTFQDKYGNYWHIGTVTISQKHMFERRLALYPTFFDADGILYSSTKFGDYPHTIPQRIIESQKDIFPGWMILSYNKKVDVSSTLDESSPQTIVDEDIRTYWSAATGNAGEYAILDLGNMYDVYALQINFAEQKTNLFGLTKNHYHKYKVECSTDGENWKMLIDKSNAETDLPHDYTQLDEKVNCRYLKLTNVEVPDGNFAVSGFRVFGLGNGNFPAQVSGISVNRDPKDLRKVNLSWDKPEGAVGYNISYGVDKNKLYQNYMVYSDTSVTINSLNVNLDYYFAIEAFNENGITKSSKAISTK